MIPLPQALTSRLAEIYTKTQIDAMQQVFETAKRPVSFRINLLQSNVEEIELALEKASITYTKLDFPKNCYILDENFLESDLWRLKIYKKGKIYIQSVSSQIPVNYFSSFQNISLKILDTCAAPGGKTSQLSGKYQDAEIFAFESNKIRHEKMEHNLKKLGCNEIKTIHDSIENISKYLPSPGEGLGESDYFDCVLIDAPCSNEGSLSLHNEKFLKDWDISHINKNYKRQKRICDSAIPYLKDGGELIYSTCTLAPEENEAVIHYLLCNYPELSLAHIELTENEYTKTTPALKSFGKHPYKKEISEHCLRVIPSKYSEGFFVAKLVKHI